MLIWKWDITRTEKWLVLFGAFFVRVEQIFQRPLEAIELSRHCMPDVLWASFLCSYFAFMAEEEFFQISIRWTFYFFREPYFHTEKNIHFKMKNPFYLESDEVVLTLRGLSDPVLELGKIGTLWCQRRCRGYHSGRRHAALSHLKSTILDRWGLYTKSI